MANHTVEPFAGCIPEVDHIIITEGIYGSIGVMQLYTDRSMWVRFIGQDDLFSLELPRPSRLVPRLCLAFAPISTR